MLLFEDNGHTKCPAASFHATLFCIMEKHIIIGIDPGSRCTGYGVIWATRQHQSMLAYGFIRSEQSSLGERLHHIHQKISAIITEYQPTVAAIEQVFTCKNPQSALKLGQARGAALSALAGYSLPIYEYSARQIKKTVVGYGAAEKIQVQHMVRLLLKLTETPQADAADALAIAICHSHHHPLRSTQRQGIAT